MSVETAPDDARPSDHARPAPLFPQSRGEDGRARLENAWAKPRRLAFIAEVNNTHIGIIYIATGLAFFVGAGVLALLMRIQLAYPGLNVLDHATYNQFFTMHGTVMMFLFAVPIVEAFAVLVLPAMLGARDMPFPWLSAFGYWCYALGGTLLSAHTVRHLLLAVVAPPLLLAGRPGVALAWALQKRTRRQILPSAWRPVARVGRPLARPLPAAAPHGAALWAWHAPSLVGAALASEAVHWLQHASFLGTALLFWHALGSARVRSGAAAALAAAFATLMHSGLLGALVTLATVPLHPGYGARAEPWGLDALADQQLAGLIMWVSMSLAYLWAGLALTAAIIGGAGERAQCPPTRLGRARSP